MKKNWKLLLIILILAIINNLVSDTYDYSKYEQTAFIFRAATIIGSILGAFLLGVFIEGIIFIINRMSSSKRSFKLQVVFIIMIVIFGLVSLMNISESHLTPQTAQQITSSEFKFSPSFKESKDNAKFEEYLDSTTLIYSNYKYGFSIDYPDHWQLDAGLNEHTISRGYQKDSLILFLVNVIEITHDSKPSTMNAWKIWDDPNLNFKNKMNHILAKTANSEIFNCSYKKTYVSNHPAILAKYNYWYKELDLELEMQSLHYTIINDYKTYTVGVKVPKIFYKENPEKYDYLITNFAILENAEQIIKSL